jgi:hypothetical protein
MRVAQALGVERLEARIDRATGRGVLVAAGRAVTRTGRRSTARRQPDDTVLFVLEKSATLRQRIRGRALLTDLQRRAEADFGSALAAHVAE